MTTEKEQKEAMRKSAEFAIDLEKSLINLEGNKDFNKVFGFYFNSEPVRYTHLLADSTFSEDPGKYQAIKDSLIGIARCSAFLRIVHANAEMAKKTLEELDKEEDDKIVGAEAI